MSKPKLNQNLSSTEFEVRLHSYSDIHHPTPPTTGTHHVVVVVNWPGSAGQRQTVQLYSHTQVSGTTLHIWASNFLILKIIGFWKFLATGRRVIHCALKNKSANLVQFFFQNHSRRENSKTWTSLGTYFSVCSYSRYLSV